MDGVDDFESVRRDPDPVRRGRRATELLTIYQQRAAELARLRKTAIEEAHHDRGMSYTEIAAALGITKGRVTQIRNTAPRPERALFGVGPVSVGAPHRYQTTDRERRLIAAEDAQTGEELERLLSTLTLAVTRYQIEPDQTVLPHGDTIVVCGPKSAPLASDLLSRDPALRMTENNGRWWIHTQDARIGSPMDNDPAASADVAYIARHREDFRVIVHIAGIHAIGSLGAAHFLIGHTAELFHQVGDRSFSLTIRASYEGLMITETKLVAGPYIW
jgi:hypothetical protein